MSLEPVTLMKHCPAS